MKIFMLLFNILFVTNSYGLTNDEIVKEIEQIEQSSPYNQCINFKNTVSCKELFLNDYYLNDNEIKNVISVVRNNKDFIEIIVPCLKFVGNPSAICKYGINQLKQKNISEAQFYDYIYNEHNVEDLKKAVINNPNKKKKLEIVANNVDLNTWMLKEYFTVFVKSKLDLEKYYNLLKSYPFINEKEIYEQIRQFLIRQNDILIGVDKFQNSLYHKVFLANSKIQDEMKAKFEINKSKYFIKISVPKLTYTQSYSEKMKLKDLIISLSGTGSCKKIGTSTSTENVWSGNIKSKNIFYNDFQCNLPVNDKKIVASSFSGVPEEYLNDISWSYKESTGYSYNYYTESELRGMRQNSSSSYSSIHESSSSSSQSTQSSSTSTSSSSNSRGMKNIRSSGTYIGYTSWSVECNNGSNRSLYMDRNGHWHLNGSTNDMGSAYDSWSKEKLGDYVCKEF